MSQKVQSLGIEVTVTGEIVPYAFTNAESGEEIGGVNLRVPGDVVKVGVDPEVAARMRQGEIWQATGRATISKARDGKPASLRIYEVHSLKRLQAVREHAGGPVIDWGDDKPADAKATAGKVGAA